MSTLPDKTAALLRKLFNAGTDGVRWEDLTPAEQHLAKDLDHGPVDFEPRWQPNPGQTAVVAVGQRVLTSHAGRWEVVAPAIDGLLGHGVERATLEQALGACHLRGIKITAALLEGMVLGIDPNPDSARRTHGIVIRVDDEPGPLRYTFSHR